MRVYYAVVPIKGARHQGDRIESARPGKELDLIRKPHHLHDLNAIKVVGVISGHGKEPVGVGYLPRTVAAKLAPEMDAGRVFKAVYVGDEKVMILGADPGGEVQLVKLPR